MEQINDLNTELEELIDLSDYINLDLKVTKLGKKTLENLNSGKKNLNLRPEMIIKLQKNQTKNFDALYFSFREKTIDLNKETKSEELKKKFAVMKFKIKNLDILKNNNKKKDFIQKHDFENERFEREEMIEESFVENFIEKNTKGDFQVFPLYKPRKKINFFKIIFIFVAILFILLLNKIVIELLVKSAYTNLNLIKNDFSDLEKVKSTVKSSSNRLFVANILFTPFKIIPSEKVKNANHIIKGGQNLTNFLEKSLVLYENINKKIKEDGGPQNIHITDFFNEIKGNYDEINKILVSTYLEYSKIKDLGNNSLNEKLEGIKDKINLVLIILDKINKNYDTMLSLLGEYKGRKYLIVFQNNDEIRATGGFIGSVGLLDLERGKVEKIEKKDVYALEWAINQVYKDKEKAPEGLNKITGTFGLRDANYFPEFKDSANKIKFFLDKIDLKVDGIIFINQNIILDLIDDIGGIYSKTLGMEITKENFSSVISTLVESEVFKEGSLGTPKQALFNFAEELFERLNYEKKYYNYLKIVFSHIKNRDLVIYSFNPIENSFLWKLGINGDINFREKYDFNYPIYTSIGGNKTDRYIDYRYEKIVKKVENSCDFNTNLKIFNTHTYSVENEKFTRNILAKYDKLGKKLEDIINIQGKGDNKSFLRILIPKETEVKLKDGQKVFEYEKYKIIELYTQTKVGQTTNYEIEYILKNNYCNKDYSYKFFKQPGIKDYQILFNVLGKENEYSNIKTDFIYKDLENDTTR